MEVVVAGNVDETTRQKLQSRVPVKFLGVIPREQIPALARSSHLMYCAEVNPPCPNSVIEALACGLPVVGFDSGSLKELVTQEAGRVVPYGGDPWKLETPDVAALALSAADVLMNQEQFRAAARKRAESAFGLEQMTEAYLKVLLEK
jgi:glycosyltransferase involved in cell wall biosynthesis